MALSNEYEAALEAHNEAGRIFTTFQLKYRAMAIGDDEFLAARAAYDEAGLVFDVAFLKEADRPVEVEAEAEDTQMNLDL